MDLGVSIHSIVHLEVSQMTHKAKEPLYNVQKEYAMWCWDLKLLLN